MPSSFDAILREHQSKIWKLASSLTRGYGGTPLQEDLVAAGTVALWRISERYDPLRGTTLWQRAFVRVRGAMIDELRNQSPISRHDREKMKSLGKTSLELVPWGAIRPVSMEAAEHVPSGKNPEEEAVRSERIRMVGRLLGKLEQQDRWLLQSYLFNGFSMADIGRALKLSEARICQLIHRAHGRLEILMEEEGIMDGFSQDEDLEDKESRDGDSLDEASPIHSRARRSQVQTLTHDGLTLTIREWSKKIGLPIGLLYGRIKQGWPIDKTLTTPPKVHHCRKTFTMAESLDPFQSPMPLPGSIEDQSLVSIPKVNQDVVQEIIDPVEVLSVRQKCWRLDQIDSQIATLMAERKGIVSSLSKVGP